ncbi:3TM-type holin [Carboxylicivirga marina]|uniref:Holin of 3TMs, for gene-transfer release n=1 Tax=Carboxylicivirga marina TaxID=2800988 RepID=A0ABS1HLL6_9BACT|nr:3TM-type holin [Carboxylicivirga marina]MBK3518574.1 hypothetical protein [Carboxylicivirga marina]
MTIPIGKIVDGVVNTIDELHTSREEEMKMELELRKITHNENLGQIEINKIEAAHKSVFVAGWRPFIGWVCGLALLYNFILRDIMVYAIKLCNASAPPPPALQMEHLMTVVIGMLGLGVARTYEKTKGVNADSLKAAPKKGFLGGLFKRKR